MQTSPIRRALTVPILVFLSISCARTMPAMDPLGALEEPEAEFSPVRYWDRDLVSLNDRCPNTHARLNPAIAPIYVNGRPIGFC